jgi:hypothetical protein
MGKIVLINAYNGASFKGKQKCILSGIVRVVEKIIRGR